MLFLQFIYYYRFILYCFLSDIKRFDIFIKRTFVFTNQRLLPITEGKIRMKAK